MFTKIINYIKNIFTTKVEVAEFKEIIEPTFKKYPDLPKEKPNPFKVPPKPNAYLTPQLKLIYTHMKHSGWQTAKEIENATGVPHGSLNKQLFMLQKPKHGNHLIDKRSSNGRHKAYRLILNPLAVYGERKDVC